MKNLFLLAACLTLFARVGMAQQAAPPAQTYNYSLADCINYAYLHQDTVKNAMLDVQNADYKIKETIASGLPQVNGSVSFQKYFTAPATVGPNLATAFSGGTIDPTAPLQKYAFGAVKYSNNYALNASQLLFSGTYIVGLQSVKTFKELYERSLVRSKIETNVNVTKAYYQVLVGGEQLKLFDSNIAQLKQQLDQTTAQNQQGFVEKIDVDRLSVQYNNLVTNRENTSRALTLYIQMLKFQMGMPIESDLKLTDKLADVNLEQAAAVTNPDTAFYRNRIEYNLLETNLHLNMLDVKDKKAAYLPTLSLNANVTDAYQENNIKYLYNNAYPYSFIGLSLNVPIFSGGMRSNQLKESRISVLKSQNDLANAKIGFQVQANAASITFYNSVQSLNNQKRSRELAAEVLRVSKIKYQQGVGSSIEVTQAQNELDTADNQYIQALFNALVDKVDVDKAYGRIK